ncbi:hypothetical protein J6590_042002 [Homalodisca vitripennis]|nr:hypothetical protein J6590_042002 [Homalodisca vitripennis]
MDTWINEEAKSQKLFQKLFFHNWFRDVFFLNSEEERPALLIYDGHTIQISTKLIRLAQENNKKEKLPKREFVAILTRFVEDHPKTNNINGFMNTGTYDPEKNRANRDKIPEIFFKVMDLQRHKNTLPNTNTELLEETATSTATLTIELETTSTDAVAVEEAASSTGAGMKEVDTTTSASGTMMEVAKGLKTEIVTAKEILELKEKEEQAKQKEDNKKKLRLEMRAKSKDIKEMKKGN